MKQEEIQIIKQCVQDMKAARDRLKPFCFPMGSAYANSNTVLIFNRLNVDIDQFIYCLETEDVDS